MHLGRIPTGIHLGRRFRDGRSVAHGAFGSKPHEQLLCLTCCIVCWYNHSYFRFKMMLARLQPDAFTVAPKFTGSRTNSPHANVQKRSVAVCAASNDASESSSPLGDPAELGILALRLATCSLMVHHGLEKLADPEGFSTFVVAKYLSFLPAPLFLTYCAAATQLICPPILALGLPKGLSRLSALALCGTMTFAMIFHLNAGGLEGFPLGVVPDHNYQYEAAMMLLASCLYFLLAGPGKLSVAGLMNKE